MSLFQRPLVLETSEPSRLSFSEMKAFACDFGGIQAAVCLAESAHPS